MTFEEQFQTNSIKIVMKSQLVTTLARQIFSIELHDKNRLCKRASAMSSLVKLVTKDVRFIIIYHYYSIKDLSNKRLEHLVTIKRKQQEVREVLVPS